MSHNVTHEIKADFRQNYVPDPVVEPGNRHWMLDFEAARDLLKAKLRKVEPGTSGIFGKHEPALDAKLGNMIDELGLRSMVKPTNKVQELFVTAKFFKMMVKVQLGLALG